MAGLFGSGLNAPQIKQATVTPTGVAGSTYVKPQQVQTGGNLRALADALGGLNTALTNYGSVKAKEAEDPQSKDNREWIARRQQMTYSQLKDEVRNNTADGNRVREDAYYALLAERANDDFRTQWTTHYNTTFDRSTGDASAEYQQMRAEIAEGLGNEIAKGAFYRLTADHYSAWMNKDTEQKVDLAKQEVATTVVASFRNSIDDSLNIHGLSADKAAEIVFRKSASNRDFLGLSGQEQNDTLFAIAEEYAQNGNHEVAKAILTGTRVGANGETVPSLIKTAKYSTKAAALIEQAQNKYDADVQKKGFDTFTEVDDMVLRGAFTKDVAEQYRGKGHFNDARLASYVSQSDNNRLQILNKQATAEQRRLLKQNHDNQKLEVLSQAYSAMTHMGGSSRLKDVEIDNPAGDGKSTYSKTQIVKDVTAKFEERMDARQNQLISDGAEPEQAKITIQNERLTWYSGNKIENDVWDNTLNGVAGRATLSNLMQRGSITTKLIEDAELYRSLKAKNPAYLSTLLKDRASREFLESYDNAVTNRRMSKEDAMHFASAWTSQDERAKSQSLIKQQDADTMAQSVLRSMGAEVRGANYVYVMERIQQLSSGSNMTAKEVKSRLAEDLADTSVVINGVIVAATNDLPDDFPPLIEEVLKDHFEVFGKQYGLSGVEDLAILPVNGQSQWQVVSKSLGWMPIGASYITPQALEAKRNKRDADRQEQTRKLIAAKDQERSRLKAEYDAEIQAEQRYINRYGATGGKFGLAVRDALQRQLDDRLARDKHLIEATSEQRSETRWKKREADAKANAEKLGFKLDNR